jgi:hypothetical protein
VVGCKYHPEQRGIGICMRCRSVICSACCTRIDGVNHCHACLVAAAHKAERPEVPVALGRFAAAGVLLLAWLLFTGMLWLSEGRLSP